MPFTLVWTSGEDAFRLALAQPPAQRLSGECETKGPYIGCAITLCDHIVCADNGQDEVDDFMTELLNSILYHELIPK